MLRSSLSLCLIGSVSLLSATAHSAPTDSPTGYILPAPGKESSINYDSNNQQISNLYGGVGIGYTQAEYGDLDGNAGFGADVFLEDQYIHGSIYMGYQFTPQFAVELGYFSTTEENKKNLALDSNNDHRVDGGYVDVVVNHFVNNQLALLGSAGLGYYTQHNTADDFFSISPTTYYTDSSMAYRLGLGTEYILSERWSSRLMGRYSNTDFDDTDRDHLFQLSVGLKYRF